jgi:uncharacterized protein (DUF2225 family)
MIEITEENVKQYVLDKKMTCDVCGAEFTEQIARLQKLRFLSTDGDLHPNYDPMDPLLYDVVICPSCGYAAMSSYFGKVSSKQKEQIRQGVTPKFRPREWSKIMTYPEALDKYKLALVTAMVKEAKNSELGYICAKIAWLNRLTKNDEGYKEFAAKAITEFEKAYEEEDYPICGMDEPTLGYLLAYFDYVCDRYDEAMRWLGRAIPNRGISPRVKDKCIDLKALVQEKQQK